MLLYKRNQRNDANKDESLELVELYEDFVQLNVKMIR